jgi:hypothetical protein
VTTPEQPGPWGPQQGQPGGQPWGQQPGQGWQQPQPWQQQPYPPQQGFGGEPPQQGFAGQPMYGGEPPRKGGKRGLIVGLVIALVVAIGGGTTWFLLAQQTSAGASSPTDAALKLTDSFANGDLVGVLDSLAPAEATLLTDPIQDATGELKRLKVLDQSADPKSITGVQVKSENLKFDEAAAEQVNDHVTITKLTAGKITISSDLGKLPLAKEFVDQALGGELPADRPSTDTIDIAEEVQRSGEPVRIATVKVDGQWYPSLLYTVADYALKDGKKNWPATPIAANGAASPNDAVKEMTQAALDADLQRVIELLPPDEMGVMHDAGQAILDEAKGELPASGAKLLDLQTQASDVTGGQRVTLTSLRLQGSDGKEYSVTKDGDCYSVAANGKNQKFCADDLVQQIENQADSSMPKQLRDVLQHLTTGILGQGIGVVTTQHDGKYYVSPLRTLTEQGMTVLRSLQPGDLTTLFKYAN